MEKIKTKLLLLLMCFTLLACQNTTTKNQDKIKIDVFVLSTCSNCQAFEKIAVPALEKEFGDQLELTLYDIDDTENINKYHEVTSHLENYDETYLNRVPFIVVEGYFAVLAYNTGEETALIEDIHHALKGESLSKTLEEGRWLFKEEN